MITPPAITAAIALSSKPMPRMGPATVSRVIYSTAATPTAAPQIVNAAIF